MGRGWRRQLRRGLQQRACGAGAQASGRQSHHCEELRQNPRYYMNTVVRFSAWKEVLVALIYTQGFYLMSSDISLVVFLEFIC